MLTLSDRQMRAMETYALRQSLLPVLRRHFTEKALELGTRFPAAVDAALARAAEHGFRENGDLSKYAMLEFALHPAFDRDPAMPWAADILGAGDIPTPGMRMDLLLTAACDALRPGEPETPSNPETPSDAAPGAAGVVDS